MSVYQAAVIEALETKGEPLTVRQIMEFKSIPHTKNTYVISAVKKLLNDKKIYQPVLYKKGKTLWMDTYFSI